MTGDQSQKEPGEFVFRVLSVYLYVEKDEKQELTRKHIFALTLQIIFDTMYIRSKKVGCK